MKSWTVRLLVLMTLLLCVAGPGAGTRGGYASYLSAYLFWIGLSLGCLAITMLHHLVGGEWGLVTRGPLQAAHFLAACACGG